MARKDPKGADLARKTLDEDLSAVADGANLLRVDLGGARVALGLEVGTGGRRPSAVLNLDGDQPLEKTGGGGTTGKFFSWPLPKSELQETKTPTRTSTAHGILHGGQRR
jgi:hypothetical protein